MAEYKSIYTGEQIDAGIAKANTALQEHQDISGKVDKVQGKQLSTNDFTNEEKEKLDGIDMSTKQDTLVSETNIKTINGNSILGSGNLVIEGSGGGLSSIAHDETLTGAGTNETPLGVDTTKIATKSDLNGKQATIDSSHKLSSDLVDDTNKTNKFVTSIEKTNWSGKQDQLVSGINIKTINNTSILGSGNITIEGGGGSSVHEIYVGDTEPSETSILLWVDTSGEPSPGTTNPVTNLVGTTTSNSATLTWTASSNATSYKIYQGDNFIDSTTNVTHTVGNLVASTEYTFGVVATGAGGDSTKVTVTLTTQEGGGGSLPAEYQEVEYVKPVGIANQINTGIENSNIAKIEMGLYNDYSKIMKLTGTATNDSWAISNTSPYICTQPIQPGNPLSSVGYSSFSMTPASSEYLNLTKYVDFVFNVTSNSTGYLTFGNDLSGEWNTGDAKYYYVKLYNSSNILIANYVPCYRKSDNKVGMYDLVNEAFFLPVYGNFEKGENV